MRRTRRCSFNQGRGWQRDATCRFTADDWNVPQYVYLYAHNDKDAASVTSGHVDEGGNEDPTGADTTTVIKHYVETQDTLDNMQGTGQHCTPRDSCGRSARLTSCSQ